MPALIPALVAQTAVAAPVVAGTAAATTAATAAGTAAAQAAAAEAAKLAALEGGKAATLEAGKTAALEASKKGIIDASMQQASQQAATQAGQQGIAQAGTQAAQQSGVEAAKQGIFSANPAGMPPTAGAPVTPAGPATTLPPAGNTPQMTLDQQLAQIQANPTDTSKFTQFEQVANAGNNTPLVQKAATPVDPSNTYAFKESIPNFNATQPINGPVPEFMSPQAGLPQGSTMFPQNSTIARAGADQGIAQMNTAPTSELMMKPTFAQQFPLSEPSALQKGFETGLSYVKENPITSGMGLMSAGQYMNQPKSEEEDKDKYKSTVDMSEFKPMIPQQPSFTRSYDYQNYQSGGPVEDMSRMNSIGANTGFPMAQLQTPAYAVSSATPMPVNTLSPTADASVNAYTGAAQFAEGGLSAAQRKEYGLSTRSQRASRDLVKSYEEMEAERQREAMKLFGESSLPSPRPIARSRTQELSSPFSAAQTEHARLGKKAKVPVVPMPKTNLGDIDNYMDIPIEAAQGGIMHGLGGYSDGGRLLRGPGDGVSDSIPAVIGKRQPARLADGEFVVPARIVSELGNGSTEAGARKLYAMMERVQANRKKSIGKKKVAVNSKSDKHLPA
jgi:hypothetical protein